LDAHCRLISQQGFKYLTSYPRTRGHPHDGPHTGLHIPQPEGLPGVDGYAAELGLAEELPAAIAQYRGQCVEYGVVERAYALRCPGDFAAIVSRYGHNAVRPKQYTASAFLAGVPGVLSKNGAVLYHPGPATGRWKYNGMISWWAAPPAPDWESALSSRGNVRAAARRRESGSGVGLSPGH
jgi:hypothetical protein